MSAFSYWTRAVRPLVWSAPGSSPGGTPGAADESMGFARGSPPSRHTRQAFTGNPKLPRRPVTTATEARWALR